MSGYNFSLQQVTKREAKEQRLKENISRCLLLSEEDRNFWLKNASILPNVVLDNVIQIIENKNKTVNRYIEAALENDPDHRYLAELKKRIQKIKEQAFIMDESTEKQTAEASLEEQLKKLEK